MEYYQFVLSSSEENKINLALNNSVIGLHQQCTNFHLDEDKSPSKIFALTYILIHMFENNLKIKMGNTSSFYSIKIANKIIKI